MTDIVERLRLEADKYYDAPVSSSLHKAADEIERLLAENAKLREALEEAEDRAVHWHKQHGILRAENAKLREALDYFFAIDPEKTSSWLYSRNKAEDLANAALQKDEGE